MDNKVLIIFVAVVVAFLALPVVMKQVKGATPAETVASDQGTGKAQKTANIPPELLLPPLLNEANLIGTEWQIQIEQYKLKVTLQAGGVVFASHPMAKALTGLDYLEGRWRVEGDRAHVSTYFGGNEYAVALKIAGMKLYYINENGKIDEVQRYR